MLPAQRENEELRVGRQELQATN